MSKKTAEPLLFTLGFGWLAFCLGFYIGHLWSCFDTGFWLAGLANAPQTKDAE